MGSLGPLKRGGFSRAGASSVEPRLRALERAHTVNVKDFGAKGDGVTNDQVAIQAVITYLTALGGGLLFFPDGDYIVNGGLVHNTPAVPIAFVGAGMAQGTTARPTRLRRTSGSATILTIQGNGNTTGTRAYGEIRNLEIDGGSNNGATGKGIVVQRVNDFYIDRVRVRRCSGTGAQFTQLWNCSIDNFYVVTCGNGTTDPAVIFDAVAGVGSQGGSATVLGTNWQLESNAGTDLKFTGSSGDSAPTNDVSITNLKFEGSTGASPFIDFDYAQHVKLSNVYLHNQAASRTGTPLIQQIGTNTGTSSNKIENLQIDTAVTGIDYLVRQSVGSLQFGGCLSVAGAADPTLAAFRVEATVSSGRFRLTDNLVHSLSVPLVSDARSSPSVASAATITLPLAEPYVSVTGTTNITSITAQRAGTLVTLVFTGVLTVTDGSNLSLAGNLVTANNTTLTLRSDGTNWREVARSVN